MRINKLRPGLFALACAAGFIHHPAKAQETKIVGSSTVSKFAHVAQRRLRRDGVDVSIEATGTSGGFSLFCTSRDPHFAPVTLASRRIKDAELAQCAENGLGEIKEYDLGLSGVVVARKKSAKPMALSRRDIFLALAAQTPKSEEDCTLDHNHRTHWNEVRNDLPDWPIEVYGPPATSGTRASFIDLAMVEGAKEDECMKALAKKDRAAFEKTVSTLRADGRWIDAGENDSVIIAAIRRMPHALGVTGYPLYLVHEESLAAAKIDGVAPGPRSIGDGSYPLSRVLRVYAKKEALTANPEARAFIDEMTGEAALGPKGYMRAQGLIPFNSHGGA